MLTSLDVNCAGASADTLDINDGSDERSDLLPRKVKPTRLPSEYGTLA